MTEEQKNEIRKVLEDTLNSDFKSILIGTGNENSKIIMAGNAGECINIYCNFTSQLLDNGISVDDIKGFVNSVYEKKSN